MPFPAILAALVLGGEDTTPPASRFELASPLPTVPGVMIDRLTTGYGLAQERAKASGVQGRTLWIDATANLDRYNSEEKIVALVKKIGDVGFNTVVFDIKPISGQVVYNSRIAPKLVEWKGKTMDAAFDPLPLMIREAHKNRLQLFVSLNAFSEGHRLFNVGPGYSRPTQQTVLYEGRPILRAGDAQTDLVSGIDRLPAVPAPNSTAIPAPVPSAVGVVTSLAALAPRGGFYAVVRKDGTVLEANEVPAPLPPIPTPPVTNGTLVPPPLPAKPAVRTPITPVPRGGAIVAGVGDGAAWLAANARLSTRLQFDTAAEFVPIRDRPEQQYPLMMNPFHPAVQQYALDILREVARNYDIDGLLYDDRLRFGGQNADFSELTRAKFEDRVGRKLNWPDDVFKWTLSPQMTRGMQPGPYYDQWMAFRADATKDFVQKARYALKAIRPTCLFGCYAGSWYGEYPANGHNYASPDAESGGFWFASPAYQKAGTAPLLDIIMAGCYYPIATIYEAFSRGTGIGSTVEASGTLVNRLVRDDAWTYGSIALSDFKDDPLGLTNALQAALASTQGVMVFDLSHDIEPMWDTFAQAFAQRKEAPTAHMELLAEVKKRRAALDRLGKKDPPIVIAAGTSGTGQ